MNTNLNASENSAITPEKQKTKIFLPTLHGIFIEDIDAIVRCESDNSYTTFYFQDGRKIVVSKPISAYEKMLSDHNFLRIHKCHIIKLNFVKEYIRGKGGQVRMVDCSVVDVSPDQKSILLFLLENL